MTAVSAATAESFIRQVAQSFGKACDSYLPAARLQQQVALDALSLLPADKQGHLLDLGCGPGWIHPRFASYCSHFTAADLSAGMLAKAASQRLPAHLATPLATNYVQADAQQLPLAARSVDKLFSSLMLQWCAKPAAVFAEIDRVLAPGGRVVLTTLVDGTLAELKQAFASLDQQQHVNRFLPAAEVIAAAEPVSSIRWQFEQRCYPLFYPDVISLARELKALGANQVAGRQSRGLTGKGYWQQLAAAYDLNRTALGLPASYQVLIITGYKNAN
ncbi:methyltransferase domain-containing protein [Rheinheimera sp. EpRS3]|uniref:methyltransferase domain-containing protein n=1 Tax=Rheinheimera sp. EpRS3 TaxID=1712383 RepID=UPI00074A9654|nr:methyltransferase domain-containing protein [Rheinheimera sp. EpRS3]KUM51557.1 malonyl-[acyl-carrier protein] O-methyltransferase BioC [Rheinheimera sp. EpRS3]